MRLTINKIKKIVFSNLFNRNKKEKWYQDRLNICKTCPFNSSNKNFYKFNKRDWKWFVINFGRSFCTICGCNIKAKASIEIEDCGLVDINETPKWKSII